MDTLKLVPKEGQQEKETAGRHNSLKLRFLNLVIYLSGLGALAVIIADPFTMSTYFSDNSLLPGVVNREFSLKTEADYYLGHMRKMVASNKGALSFNDKPALKDFIKSELDTFGLRVYEQSFSYLKDGQLLNGTNIYSVLRGERSTSAEAIALCAPFKTMGSTNTLPGVALSMALMKYFSTRSYWAKDVIVLFVDHDSQGASAWLDSYYDVHYSATSQDISLSKLLFPNTQTTHYESLEERSGPMQASIVLELYDSQFTKMNIKIQGLLGQLPNLDLFNLAIELAARESVTPYFHGKSLPFAQTNEELYYHHVETAIAFIKNQATMQADGLHGLFLKYAVQSLTLECSPLDQSDSKSHILASLLNAGRMVEGIMRSLNNLTERFNRSYYFYIILSLRRFTSIGYYMIPFGLITAPLLIRTIFIYLNLKENSFIGMRAIILLTVALALSLLSCFNISAALIKSIVVVPFLFII